MTRYKKIQARARGLGIDTRKDKYLTPPGYWITTREGNPVWDDCSFAGSLDELESLVNDYDKEIADRCSSK